MATQEATERRYTDGNHTPIPEGELIDITEGVEPYVIDGHGNELRVDDLVLVESLGRHTDGFGSDWLGTVARVTSVNGAGIYERDGVLSRSVDLSRAALPDDKVRKHWPKHPNGIAIERISYPGRATWAIPRESLRKIDLTTNDGHRLRLAKLHSDLAAIDRHAAQVAHDRAMKIIAIRELSAEIEVNEEAGVVG